jgi:hypothetical protein
MSDELLLHETPIVRAFFLRLWCLLHGGHKYGEIERIHASSYLETYWACSRVCVHCRYMQFWNEDSE